MYIVICTDEKELNIRESKWSDFIFGPFEHKYMAEEWVDNHCYKSYWIIVKVNKESV